MAEDNRYLLHVSQPRQGEGKVEYYKRLAKQADKRMRRIEELATQKGFENIEKWAYANAIQKMKELGLGERWEKAPVKVDGKIDLRELNKRITGVTQFLEMPTSTKSGIMHGYDVRTKTINEKYGTNFSWEDIAKFYESSLWDKLDSKFASDSAMRVYAIIQKYKLTSTQDLNAAIKEAAEKNQKLTDSEEILNMVRKSLRKNGIVKKSLYQYLDSNPFDFEE